MVPFRVVEVVEFNYAKRRAFERSLVRPLMREMTETYGRRNWTFRRTVLHRGDMRIMRVTFHHRPYYYKLMGPAARENMRKDRGL